MFAAAACGGDDGSSQPQGTWQLLASNQTSSLLSVWAPSTDNVWVVGGKEGAGGKPVIWHLDATGWTKLDPMAAGGVDLTNVDLWSVFGFDDGTVFIGGSNGTILRYKDGTFTKLTTPTTNIVFGLWGASSSDVWAVGGQASSAGFVWRYSGGSDFTAVSGVPQEIVDTGTVWKVVGRSATDVFMSCTQGQILHWDGQALAADSPAGPDESLFSIGCNSEHCFSAGTNGTNGVIYEYSDAGWMPSDAAMNGPVWRGVTPTGDHSYIVGVFGAVLRYDSGSWVSDPHGLTTESLHAAWSDADGDLFAVGGRFDRAPTTEGVLLYKGAATLPTLP